MRYGHHQGEDYRGRTLCPQRDSLLFRSAVQDQGVKGYIHHHKRRPAEPGKIKALKKMGISRLNFSLDTLDPERFKAITRRDRFNQVWNAIKTAHELGIAPLKINTVALKGFNDDEIKDIAGLTLEYPFHIRFIEYMPMGDTTMEKEQQILTEEIQEIIASAHGPLKPVARDENDGPAKKIQTG